MPRIRFLLRLATTFAVLLVAGGASAADPSAFEAALGRGISYAALASFGAGLLAAATPCVWPMIAITVGVFGAGKAASRVQGTLRSAAFVLGIEALFVPLGVGVGLTGAVFGSLLQSPWVIGTIVVLLVALSLSMFGLFELDLPSSLKNRLVNVGGGGYVGAFLLGFVLAPITLPCTGAFMGGILTWLASSQSAFMGAIVMSAFGLGLGLPFFLVGAFAVQLPKSGGWMMGVKSFFGVVLLAVALYFLAIKLPGLSSFASPAPLFLGGMGVLVVLGLLMGAVHKDFAGSSRPVQLSKSVGILLAAGGAFLFVQGVATPERKLAWEALPRDSKPHLIASLQERARAEGKPLLVDFTASWCIACKELSKETFADESVQREAGRFLAAKVDATDDEDPAVLATMTEFKVNGLPTVILFDSSGREAKRLTDFVDAPGFLAMLKEID